MSEQTHTVALRVTPQELKALLRFKMLNDHSTMSAALRDLLPLEQLQKAASDE